MSVSVSYKGFVQLVSRLPQEVLSELRRKAESFYAHPEWCSHSPYGMYLLGVMRYACCKGSLKDFHREVSERPELYKVLGLERVPLTRR